MIIPICFATLSVVVVLRPLYIISICDLYSDYLEENKEEAELPDDPSKGRSALITFDIVDGFNISIFVRIRYWFRTIF